MDFILISSAFLVGLNIWVRCWRRALTPPMSMALTSSASPIIFGSILILVGRSGKSWSVIRRLVFWRRTRGGGGLMAVVTAATFRAPGLLAKIVTTFDILTQGRAWLGIGVGHYEEEARGLGMTFPASPNDMRC